MMLGDDVAALIQQLHSALLGGGNVGPAVYQHKLNGSVGIYGAYAAGKSVHAADTLSERPVSYTHLDVYKRQL